MPRYLPLRYLHYIRTLPVDYIRPPHFAFKRNPRAQPYQNRKLLFVLKSKQLLIVQSTIIHTFESKYKRPNIIIACLQPLLRNAMYLAYLKGKLKCEIKAAQETIFV